MPLLGRNSRKENHCGDRDCDISRITHRKKPSEQHATKNDQSLLRSMRAKSDKMEGPPRLTKDILFYQIDNIFPSHIGLHPGCPISSQ